MSTIASQPSAARALREAEVRRGVGGARAVPEARSSGAELRGLTPGTGRPAAVLHWGPEALRVARGAAPESGAPAPPEADAAPSAASESPFARGTQLEPGAPPAAEGDVAPGETSADESGDTGEERDQLQDLRRRDREVRTHEQAHKSAGGAHAGSIHLEFTVGPDGKRYASSGSVSIDVSAVKGDPEATIRKMQIVQRAATAPADPSGADRQVAARAASTASQARAELAAKRYADTQKLSPGTGATPGSAAEPQATARGQSRVGA